ncbi:6-hydroxy-D-nicotine oxidase [Tolypocladium ophioglossoides CBS 100239]|uniref:6-hydroxy-D-nicotine oxidase n=1 Tax=Tolypocladium ophioglossoides (strain CBS 100239) TaxID=1163406 RepID=A0A0L0NC43_TOLOC|nr:6-hydroxy-D-nicotine oxidase [Tolypocladium ophioglossoides CBS 100239]
MVQLSLSLPCLSGLAFVRCTPLNGCRAYPGSHDWPSNAVWKGLNETLGGRLLAPAPPGAVCHPGQPTYNADQCPNVKAGWSSYDWHTDNPVSVMWDQFANYTCLPDPKGPCSGQGYPPYVVNATTAEHVKHGIEFARKHNIRINVKNTGHDYLGRSIAPGALSIWMHHMNSIEYHADEFKLDGSGKVLKGSAVTVGGGTQMYDIYRYTDAHNQTVVGGGGKSVGVGGFISGGGHSTLAPRFGLAADNVIQIEVVTPMCKILTVNEDQHRDLFWALRGGGGSTFGIMTKITMWTHPTPKITDVKWMAITDPKAPFVSDLISYIVSQMPYLMDSGMSGYNLVSTGMPNPTPFPGLPTEIAGFMGANLIQNADDPNVAAKIFKPLNDTLKEKWQGQAVMFQTTEQYPSFLAWFDKNYDQGQAGQSSYMVSRLLDGKALTGDPEALGKALKAGSAPSGGMLVFMVAGKGVQDAKPRGGNAVNPAWRTAYVHAVEGMGFAPFNKTAEEEAIKLLDTSFQPLRALTPNSGAYINEALPFEKDWQHTFWGTNYKRLLKIKRAVDPTDVFWCSPCVGNDRWEERPDGRLCRSSK